MNKVCFSIFAVLFTFISYGAFPLAEKGKASAEIIIEKNADQTVRFAAEELRLWVDKISGAELPIVNRPGKSKTKLFLSCNQELLKKFPADSKKLKENDGYAARTQGNNIYLFASQPKGVLNGVYGLLFKNSDIIWARPNVKFGTVYSTNPNFSLSQTDYIDIPVYKLRGWQTLGAASRLWVVRNGNNWNAVNVNNPVKRKQGMILEFGGGHNLNSIYITEKKYWEKHPDFFPLIKGKRKCPSSSKERTQLCFTNPEMTKAFIGELDKLIRENPQYETYRIMIEDNFDQCECVACRKPIKLPDGKILSPNAKNYYSTRFFIWLNTIAKYMQKHYPGKRILTFAYLFTEYAPAVKVASNIDISFCPIFKNSKFPMDSKENSTIDDTLKKWLGNTHNVTLREYYGLTGDVPRAVDSTALADWRYANQNGIVKTYSEICSDQPSRQHWGGASWDANAMYFWVLANAAWNPYKDVKEYRREFLIRVFGLASNDMEEYYRLLEQQWLKNPSKSTCDDAAIATWKYLLSPEINKKCLAALNRAEKKIQHPNSKKMFQCIKNNFVEAVKRSKKIYVKAHKAKEPPVFDPDFNTGEWADCKTETRFFLYPGGKPYSSKTEVKILYDANNIYFGVRCFEQPEKMIFRKPMPPQNIFCDGQGFEVYISAKWRKRSGYVQMEVDPSNNRYWSFCADKAWKGRWHSEAQVTKDGWSCMITISWKELGIDPVSEKQIQCALVRQVFHCTPPAAPAVSINLYGTARHRIGTFAILELEK